MKNTPLAVLDEHPDWLNPLYEEFKKRSVPFEKYDIGSAYYNPATAKVLPFYVNRLSPSAAKREHERALNYTLNYLQYLESLGARIINGSHTVLLETSKAQQAAILRKLAIPTPKTFVTNDLTKILNAAQELTFPIVLKPNCGGSGLGIRKYHSYREFKNDVKIGEIKAPGNQVLLLQEFIQPKDGYIVRVETIGGKVAYTMKVFTKDTFNLCPSDACDLIRTEKTENEIGYCVATPNDLVRFELHANLAETIKNAIETLVREAGLECAGIEYTIDKNGDWFVYDINALSILRSSFKAEYGIDGWAMLADYFIQEYKKTLSKIV